MNYCWNSAKDKKLGWLGWPEVPNRGQFPNFQANSSQCRLKSSVTQKKSCTNLCRGVSIQKIMMRRNSGRLADHNRDVNLSYQTHHLVFLSVSPNLGPTYHLGEYKTDFPFLALGCFASGNCLISLVSSCDIPAWNILSCRRVKRRLSVKRGEGMGVLGPFQDEEDIRILSGLVYLIFQLDDRCYLYLDFCIDHLCFK